MRLFRVLLPIVGIACLAVGNIVDAEKSYEYASIDVTVQVNEDSSVRIEERQSFDFTGNFHKAYREINPKGLGYVSGIEVAYGDSDAGLEYSSRKLDPLNPDSWGKYTFYRDAGKYVVEWYYDLSDTNYTWTVSYTVEGAIGFYRDYDELYWNVFTDYSVPVRESMVTVRLPEAAGSVSDLQSEVYADFMGVSKEIVDARTFRFEAKNASPGGDFTIAAGWPKGMVSQKDYWIGALRRGWGYVGAIVVLVGTLIAIVYRWYRAEGKAKRRAIIVPEYSPPRSLKPAVLEVLVNEHLSSRTWPATLVDLAVRGFLKIEEDKGEGWFSRLSGKHYFIRLERKDYSRVGASDFEKNLLDVLFDGGKKDVFSTRELSKAGSSVKQRMAKKMQGLQKVLYQDAVRETKVFDVPPRKGYSAVGLFIGMLGLLFFWTIFFTVISFLPQWVYFLGVVAAAYGCFLLYVKFEPRLTKDGIKLRAESLGFKQYLKVAERYRLANLKPEDFEKFLPYAMVFGVEKQWAKNFDNLNVRQPEWYVSAGTAHSAMAVSGAGGFSPSGFSASFASSLSSAVSSSAGGASGGGGSAGGGAGGGGGGAS